MPDPLPPPADVAERLTAIDERLARLEAHLGLETVGSPMMPPPPSPLEIPAATSPEELELEVGQNWFALGGVAALTLGAALLLALPFAGMPSSMPPLMGYAAVAVLFAAAERWGRSFDLVARYLRGSAMALLFAATLRWCFPLSRRVLDIDSPAARALLIAVVALNVWLALRRKSPWLTGLALAGGGVVVATSGAHWLALGGLNLLAILATWLCARHNWRLLALAAIAGGVASYLGLALGPLLRGTPLHFAPHPAMPAILLSCIVVFASGPLLGSRPGDDEAWPAMHAFFNCLLGYGVFLVHTAAAFPDQLAAWHILACVVLLGIAIAFWTRRGSRGPTFFYAMTGYAALSIAILKAAPAPAVFVWLSVQSLVVITTAIWFRSRFIIVANFFIFAAIVLAYVILAERESGISVGFGLVALVSARILNWQKDRLELKTELMRNAYLVTAFLVFPYALYHLVPPRAVAIAWVALASFYYGLNLIVRSPKYRWMGHATLLLTMMYVGVSRFEPVYRVLSFLVLGAVLLVVSLSFTRARRKKELR